MDVILYEKSYIRIPSKEPEELGHDSFPVDFFGREQGESIREFESKLSTEETIGYIAGTEIFIIDTMFDKITTEIEILMFRMSHKRVLG